MKTDMPSGLRNPSVLMFGALTSWSDIVRTPLPPLFDGLKAAARDIGGIQIQNRATIAGNCCTASPAGDSIPCLLTLDAEFELLSATFWLLGIRPARCRHLDYCGFLKPSVCLLCSPSS